MRSQIRVLSEKLSDPNTNPRRKKTDPMDQIENTTSDGPQVTYGTFSDWSGTVPVHFISLTINRMDSDPRINRRDRYRKGDAQC
jgi:hypothetical protein